MKKFIWQAMSESGSPSIKRCVLVWSLVLFTAELVVNAIGKQRVLDQTLQTQLFELVCGSLAAVLGINVLNGIKDIKIKQSDNNAAVGAPSPPPAAPDTTIVEASK
jgi:hypothetical protein